MGRRHSEVGSEEKMVPYSVVGAPEELVQEVVLALQGLGRRSVRELSVAREDIHFKLPAELRAKGSARPAQKEVT